MEQLIIRSGGTIYKIPYREIFVFEARDKACYIRTLHAEFKIYEALRTLADKLPKEFICTGRSFLVNAEHLRVYNISKGLLYLSNGITVPVSKSRKKDLISFFGGNL